MGRNDEGGERNEIMAGAKDETGLSETKLAHLASAHWKFLHVYGADLVEVIGSHCSVVVT